MARRAGEKGNLVAGIISVLVIVVLAFVYIYPEESSSEPSSSTGDGTAELAAAAAEAEPVAQPFSGPGYILNFTKDFNPGLAGIDDLGISIVLAVDASGSMADPPASGGPEKYLQAQAALANIVAYLQKFSQNEGKDLLLKVAIIRFDDDVDTPFPLTKMDAAGFRAIKAVVSDPATFEAGGKTTLGLALEWAAEILAQSGTIFKSAIVISDGENTLDVEPKDVLFGINENRVNASTVDVPISTRGTLVSFVGFDIGNAAFADLAKEGARVTTASNQAELEAALTSLLVADITRLESATN